MSFESPGKALEVMLPEPLVVLALVCRLVALYLNMLVGEKWVDSWANKLRASSTQAIFSKQRCHGIMRSTRGERLTIFVGRKLSD